MQQDQNIKGFTLLELLVVISIVALVTAAAAPNFNNWNKDRKVRKAVAQVKNLFVNINTQSQRGALPFVQVYIKPLADNTAYTKFEIKGLTRSAYTSRVNSGNPLDCYLSNSFWSTSVDSLGVDDLEIATHIDGESSVCFSQNGSHYKTLGKLKNQLNISVDDSTRTTNRYLIICTEESAKKSGGKCSTGLGLEKPAYMIEWTRFGNVNTFKWSGSDWTKQ